MHMSSRLPPSKRPRRGGSIDRHSKSSSKQTEANHLTITSLLLRQAWRRPGGTDTATPRGSVNKATDVIVVEDYTPAAKMTEQAEESWQKVVGAVIMLWVLKRRPLVINMWLNLIRMRKTVCLYPTKRQRCATWMTIIVNQVHHQWEKISRL